MSSCEEDLFCGINTAKDRNNMSDLEKKHTPVIDAPVRVKKEVPFEVTVEVGKLLKHPNEAGHFIGSIELFSGDTFLARADLTPANAHPIVKFLVSLTHSHPLRAIAHCNLHGRWESTKEIKVE